MNIKNKELNLLCDITTSTTRSMQNSVQFILVNIGLAHHYADWNYKHVVSPFTRIYLPQKGRATIHLTTGSFEVEPGYLYIIPAYAMHHYECHGEFSLYYIHLYEDDSRNLSIGENFNFKTQIPSNALDEMAVKHLLEINPDKDLKTFNPQLYDNHNTLLDQLSTSSHETYYQQIENESILKLLISHFLKYAKPKNESIDDRLAKTLLYIRSNLSRTIEVAELANMNNISAEYFTRLFTEQIGESPIKYIQSKRIQRAQLMLMIKSVSIQDIAYSVGYNDTSYFNRVFRKAVGCTPKEYRNRTKSGMAE